MFLLLELASQGCLLDFLRRMRSSSTHTKAAWELTSRDLIVFGIQISNAMSYVSSRGVSDLRSGGDSQTLPKNTLKKIGQG